VALDYDLSSIQEARDIARKAKEAQQRFAEFSEAENARVIAEMAKAAEANAELLAKMAVEETKFGNVKDKTTKNLFAAKRVYEYIKDMKVLGIVKEDKERKVVEMGVPMGVLMGIVPSTNPTSTIIYKSLIALKAGNAIVFSPHPGAARSSYATAQILHDAAVKAGAPEGIIGCLSKVSMSATQELMHHEDISLILATGGPGMVKAAYSSGKPAYGVGAGNVPAFIERTADIKKAVANIIRSKTFDYGVICSSENSILVDAPIKEQVFQELRAQGAYILNEDEVAKVSRQVMTPRGEMNAALVGKNPKFIAEKAGITIPEDTKLLVAPLAGYGPEYPLSYEKLTTVVALYVVKDWQEACQLAIELLNLMGIGHSFSIHSRNEEIIREFLRKPVSRVLVNSPSSLGGIGFCTGLAPALTLGCGTLGGSSTSDNVTPLHLRNIRRLAYCLETCETESCQKAAGSTYNPEDIAAIVRKVLAQMKL